MSKVTISISLVSTNHVVESVCGLILRDEPLYCPNLGSCIPVNAIGFTAAHMLCWRFSANKQWEFLQAYTDIAKDPSQCILLTIGYDDLIDHSILRY